MRPALLLARLNEIDLELDSLAARLAAIAQALQEPEALRATRQEVAAAEERLTHCRAVQRAREATQKQLADKLAQAETRLYSGQVRNPKELQDIERDVQQLRRQLAQAEDALLDAMLETEATADALASGRARLKALTEEWEATQADLRAEQATLQARLSTLRARQELARRAVPPELLPIYDSLRARRDGRAVAALEDDMCSACCVAVPPGKAEAARYSDELVYCSNCGRLLWAE